MPAWILRLWPCGLCGNECGPYQQHCSCQSGK
jgi:hypothetical protein